jgi:transporter family protein
VQAWFSVYLVVVLLPFYLLWKRGVWQRSAFHWRWSIPLIGLSLLVADIVYFTAVKDPEALISIISPVRRMSVVISFFGGVFLFGERSHIRPKALCLLVLLLGVVLLNWSGA